MGQVPGIFGNLPAESFHLRVHEFDLRKTHRSKQRWSGVWLSGFLAIVVLLSPLPVGGNHPVAWMFWTMIIGLAGAMSNLGSASRSTPLDNAEILLLFSGGLFLTFAVFLRLLIFVSVWFGSAFVSSRCACSGSVRFGQRNW